MTGGHPAQAGDPSAGRREYVLALLLGAAGAALVLFAARQGWARVVMAAPQPLPTSTVSVTGQDLVAPAGALGLAALAGLAAVLATRGLVRRLVGVLLAAFGAGIAVAVSLPVTTADVLAAAAGAGGAGGPAGSVTGGSSAGTGPAGAAAGVSIASHVTMASLPWRWAVLAGALLVIAGGLLVAWRGATWPVMSSRYDPPGPAEHGPAEPEPADSADLWESLSRGVDPTEPGPSASPPGQPAGGQGTDGGQASLAEGLAAPGTGSRDRGPGQ